MRNIMRNRCNHRRGSQGRNVSQLNPAATSTSSGTATLGWILSASVVLELILLVSGGRGWSVYNIGLAYCMHGVKTHLHLSEVSSAFHFGLPCHNSGLVAFTGSPRVSSFYKKPCDFIFINYSNQNNVDAQHFA